MLKFSVIVPVYNVEKYLPDCIESILQQNYANYELILIDDGSTDQSALLCDKYALTDDKIKVIHKKNGGTSDARNHGINNADGDYIIFVDSDDYIEPNTLNVFNDTLSNGKLADIMITRIKRVYANNQVEFMDKNFPIELLNSNNKKEIIDWVFNICKSTWSSVRYILKRSFLNKFKLELILDRLHEDVDWTSKIFLYCEIFTCTDYYWYNNRKERQGSITNTININRTLDVLEIAALNINNSKYDIMDRYSREVIFKRISKAAFFSLNYYKFFNQDEKTYIVDFLNKNQFILKYSNNLNHRIFFLFSRIFGFKAGLIIMSILH